MKKIIIDIRESYEYKMGHLPNAINIPKDILELVPENYLNKNNYYVIYCDKGIASAKLSKELNQKGYNTKSLNGGYEEWSKKNKI